MRVVPAAVLAAVAAASVLSARRPTSAPKGSGADARVPAPAGSAPAALRGVVPPPDAGVTAAPRLLHGDPRHTHRGPRGPRAAELLWRAELGAPVEAQVVASPDEKVLYVAALDGRLSALDAATGAVRWIVDLGDRAYATPLVADDGSIFAGSDAKKLFRVAPDGTVRWRLELGGEVDTAPAPLPDGSIVVAAGRELHCVRPRGDVAWRFAAKGKIFSSPAVSHDGTVLFGSQDDRLYAVGSDGHLRFSFDLGADVDASPAIGDDGAVYVGTDGGELVRIDDGKITWRVPLGGYVRGALSIARNGDVLAGVYGPSPRQVRVSPDGREVGALSVQGTGARDFGVHGGAAEDASGALYFGAQDDFVYAVGPAGELLFRFQAGADVDAPITLLSDGSAVFADDGGTVYHLRP